jgi:hypothetical protein
MYNWVIVAVQRKTRQGKLAQCRISGHLVIEKEFDPWPSRTMVSCLILDSYLGDNAVHVPSNDFNLNDFDATAL